MALAKKNIFYILFFSVLILVFFFTLSALIPGFGSPKSKPIGNVQPFTFLNQDSVRVTEKDLAGKVVVVNFFFVTCKSVCPIMNGNLKPVYDQFKSNPNFLLISHTSMPELDSVPALKHYADSMQVDQNKWMFLTGRKDSLYNMARHSYKIDNPKNFVTDINDDFIHTQFVALVNKEGEVVGIYDGLKPSEITMMSEKIKTLL